MINGVSNPGRELKTAWRLDIYARGDGEAGNLLGTGLYTGPEESDPGGEIFQRNLVFSRLILDFAGKPLPLEEKSGESWRVVMERFG